MGVSKWCGRSPQALRMSSETILGFILANVLIYLGDWKIIARFPEKYPQHTLFKRCGKTARPPLGSLTQAE
jgi:hypothetical protein